MTEKNIGYFLLAIGFLVMFAAFLFILFVFLGVSQPVAVINIHAPTIDTSAFIPKIPGLPSAPSNKIELLPAADFNKVINLTSNILFMGFVMSFGFKLADLGVKLLRPIRIEAKTN